jgi:DNA-directed RNA polymerase specialized sigma24 family protein
MQRGLVERAQRGDQEAFEGLVRMSANRLFSIAYRITRDHHRAEDAVQQTLVTIWDELPRLRDPDRFDAWTYRVVSRNSVALAKREARSPGADGWSSCSPTTPTRLVHPTTSSPWPTATRSTAPSGDSNRTTARC